MARYRWSVVGLAAVMAMAPAVAGKKTVTSIADLPRHSYAYKGDVALLFERPDLLDPIVAKAKADILATLADYDITDRATLRRLHGTLADIAMLQRNYPAARREVAIVRSLADKPLQKLTAGNLQLAYADAVASGARPGAPAFAAAFQRAYAAGLMTLPWSLFGDSAQEYVGEDATFSRAVVIGGFASTAQAQADNGGALDDSAAGQLMQSAFFVRDVVPLKAQMLAADRAYLRAKQVAKPNIWPARDIVLTRTMKLTPVVVGIWDSGVDTSLFRRRLWTNPRETANGRDDDGNGYVDDVHGIAVDRNGAWSPDELDLPPADIAPRLATLTDRAIGMRDQFSNRETPAAKRFVAFVDHASAAQMAQFWNEGQYFGNYFHGTHVAGIVARGNPAIRLMPVRRSFEWRSPPRRPTLAIAEAYAKAYMAQVAYMRAAGVRVVNMSWTVDIKTEYEDQLAANGVPEKERAAEAAKLFAIEAEGLRAAIASAPDILFVCAAGNDNNSAEFQGSVPAAFEMPNVITVAAVGQDGVPTSFTTLGPTVDIAANGYRVESFVPGGRRMQSNGTSMASPNVVNAAAKLLAIDPTLTVAALRSLLIDSATPKGTVRLLDAKAALALLRARHR